MSVRPLFALSTFLIVLSGAVPAPAATHHNIFAKKVKAPVTPQAEPAAQAATHHNIFAKKVKAPVSPEAEPEAPPAQPAPADAESVAQTILSDKNVRFRRDLDKRVHVVGERYGKATRAHVYLQLDIPDGAYAVSLGWFSKGQANLAPTKKPLLSFPSKKTKEVDEYSCVDELGEPLQLPGQKLDNGASPDALSVRGFDRASKGELARALDDFKAAVKKGKQIARCHNNLGVLMALNGNPRQAMGELNDAIALKPDYGVAYANRAFLNYALQKDTAAIADAKKALSFDSNLEPALIALSRTYARRGKTAQADAIAGELSKHEPDAACIKLMGDLYLSEKKYKEARSHYEKLVLTHPEDIEARLSLAQAAFYSGDLDEAMKRAREATQLAPDDARVHLALGKYLEANQDLKAAWIQFERVLELEPAESVKHDTYGPLLRTLVRMNEYKVADKVSADLVKRYPESAEYHFNRAWFLTRDASENRSQEAIAEYKSALELNGKLAAARYNLALLLVDAKQPKEAESQLKLFLEQSPEDPDAPSARDLLAKLTAH